MSKLFESGRVVPQGSDTAPTEGVMAKEKEKQHEKKRIQRVDQYYSRSVLAAPALGSRLTSRLQEDAPDLLREDTKARPQTKG
jgi:hypothetical protein